MRKGWGECVANAAACQRGGKKKFIRKQWLRKGQGGRRRGQRPEGAGWDPKGRLRAGSVGEKKRARNWERFGEEKKGGKGWVEDWGELQTAKLISTFQLSLRGVRKP